MRLLVLVVLFSASDFIAAKNVTLEDLSAYNYHARFGIARAAEIKAAEEIIENQRIVGGFIAPIDAYPYQAGLVIDLLGITGNSVCGGSLLTNNRVLTAAHCWFDGVNQAWRFTVVLGSSALFSGGTRIPTTTVVLHNTWTPSVIANDVALISLPYAVTFTSQIQPISLPTGIATLDTFAGNWAVASGYGKTLDSQAGVTTATVLSAVTLQVTTNTVCQASFGTIVRESNVCTLGTGGTGICGGDSGGPLVLASSGQNIVITAAAGIRCIDGRPLKWTAETELKPTYIGVSSFVAASGCQLGFPSAFARVTSFLNWIYANL